MRRPTLRRARPGHISVEYLFMLLVVLLVVLSTVHAIGQRAKTMNDNSWKVISAATP